jgi:hypothetical protein
VLIRQNEWKQVKVSSPTLLWLREGVELCEIINTAAIQSGHSPLLAGEMSTDRGVNGIKKSLSTNNVE